MPRSAANQGNDAVELPAHGRSPGSQQVHHQQYLAESQSEPASGQNLQAVARCVGDLEQAIKEFLAAWNEHPKPFVWTATVDSIVDNLSRCRQTLEKIGNGAIFRTLH
jgi:hypothetical protein